MDHNNRHVQSHRNGQYISHWNEINNQKRISQDTVSDSMYKLWKGLNISCDYIEVYDIICQYGWCLWDTSWTMSLTIESILPFLRILILLCEMETHKIANRNGQSMYWKDMKGHKGTQR